MKAFIDYVKDATVWLSGVGQLITHTVTHELDKISPKNKNQMQVKFFMQLYICSEL